MNRFLHQQLPPEQGILQGQTDTTTLAAHDFDVDTRTGFMPPNPPLASLPSAWERWERLLQQGVSGQFPLESYTGSPVQPAHDWHESLKSLPILSIEGLETEPHLRRAHLVLAFLLHIYIHSQPLQSESETSIPQSIAIPLLQISRKLQLPPVLTYSDTVLYNWALIDPSKPVSASNIRMTTLLSSLPDEAHFYLTSALIELRGVHALDLMRASMNEAFVGDATAVRRITKYLTEMTGVIRDLVDILSNVRRDCSPSKFYHYIRPWMRGSPIDGSGRPLWVFENASEHGFSQPTELAGPSAGQSSLLQALDIFLGVHKHTHTSKLPGEERPFLDRMKLYTPRHHRAFLDHLANEPQLRVLVESANNPALTAAFNEVVHAMKLFRDEHIRVVALYIISPARSTESSTRTGTQLRGTGGTNIIPFLKLVRDQTAHSTLQP